MSIVGLRGWCILPIVGLRDWYLADSGIEGLVSWRQCV